SHRLDRRFDEDGLVFPAPRPKIVVQILFTGGFFLDADRRAIEIVDLADSALTHDHESLPVVVQDPGKIDTEPDLASEGPGCMASQEIDLTGTQRKKSRRRDQRNEDYFPRVAQRGRGHRAAKVHIQTAPSSVRLFQRKSKQSVADAATDDAFGLYTSENIARLGAKRNSDQGECNHGQTPNTSPE